MENFLVFATIGGLTGASARLLYPDRRFTHILTTIFIGVFGAVVGGALSWNWWPAEVGEYHTGNLILSVLGAALAILLWVGGVYQRSLRGVGTTAP